MKKPFLLIFFLAIFQFASAQMEWSLQGNYSRPQGVMGKYIKHAGGLNLQGMYRLPNTPFSVGAEIGINGYGSQKTHQRYQFSDGSSTEVDVNVNNSFSSFMLVSRVNLIQTGGIIPYIQAKGGYFHYWTNLSIPDPQDTDGCKPLENTSLLKDGAFAATLGAGVRWDISTVFKKAIPERFWIDLSADYTKGGSVRYMNVNIPADPDPVNHHHPVTNADGSTPYTARFINTQSQVVHEHHVGNVYKSYIEQITFRLGITLTLQGQ
ncbi:hypothetical protein [Xanthocytophaga agilis]|uniref:Outer membrane protein beta-barrel domain-containing protein n=1 Tax=Xanthocytophaga agilis TaxID=3048010 RepID=A0AAE3UBD8_9BACT|nr:hypothetical protein [Xanthocytophaga agilis]MDJ1499708.1 hypothetical protein [Xanthocytophaga agilis]